MMIRGVSRNIIEISDTGNESFERVILFVRPGRKSGNEQELTAQAKSYVSGLQTHRRFYRKSYLATLFAILLSAAAGCGLTAAFFLLL